MKTDEAEKKWCPFIQNGEYTSVVMHISCATNECMAWQPTNTGEGFCQLIDPDHIWVKKEEPT